MPRLFVALPVGHQVVAALAGLAEPGSSGWRWVKPEAMHLTLAFLGEVAEERVAAAERALGEGAAAAPALDLTAGGIGGFPDERRARVLWAGVGGDLEALHDLQGRLAGCLRDEGFELDPKPYRPHVTLARSREPRALPAGLDRSRQYGAWRADELLLMESRPGPDGPRYEVRAKVGLGASAATAGATASDAATDPRPDLPAPEPVPPAPVVLTEHDPEWGRLYEAESEQVAAALGWLVDGGVLEGLAHMGSTSVPGLRAKPTIDIYGRVHPYPPGPEQIAALAAIGYTWRGEFGLPGRTYFTKGPHDYHLHLLSFASGHWERHLLFRDYLRANPEARRQYEELKVSLAERFRDDRPAYQDGKSELIASLEPKALAWYLEATGFSPVAELVPVLLGLPEGSWAVAGGWALDLHLGAPHRYHVDLDVEVDASRQAALQGALQAAGWRLDQVVADGRYAPWPPGEPLAAGVHQVHARSGSGFMDLQLAPRGPTEWRFRRDERVTLPLARAIRHADLPGGVRVPYLAPEAVLLFKSRSSVDGVESEPRDRDAADFVRVLPTLGVDARAWLADALRRFHGDHPWLAEL